MGFTVAWRRDHDQVATKATDRALPVVVASASAEEIALIATSPPTSSSTGSA